MPTNAIETLTAFSGIDETGGVEFPAESHREAKEVFPTLTRTVTEAAWTILSSSAATPGERCGLSSLFTYTLLEGFGISRGEPSYTDQ